MRKQTFISLSTAIILLNSGCTTKMISYNPHDVNKSVEQETKNHIASPLLEKLEKEEVDSARYIDLSLTKSLKKALEELSIYNNKVYILGKDSPNLELEQCSNSKLLKINNLEVLKHYIEDTSRFTLVVSKNNFYKNAAKIIKVVDKEELTKSLERIKLNINGSINIEDVLEEISMQSKFSIVYKNLSSDEKNTQATKNNNPIFGFTNEKINFSGNNAQEFLDFIRDYYDVYVTVNYNTKIITISKYEVKIFSNLLYHGVDFGKVSDSNSIQNQSAAGSGSGSATTTEAQESSSGKSQDINDAIKNIAPNATFYFDEKSGNLIITSTYRDMKKIEKYITSLDASYNKRLELEISVYEVAISNSYDYGLDLKGSLTSTNMDGSIENFLNYGTSFTKNSKLSLADTSTKLLGGGASIIKNLDVSLDSQNTSFKILNFNTYKNKVTNNIYTSMFVVTSTDYIKNITATTTTTTTTPITTTSSEVGTFNDGASIGILARIVGNEILIKAKIELTKLIQLDEKNIGEETLALPTTSKKVIPANVKLYNGEKKIIASYLTYDRADKYSGILPLDRFAIGGANGESFIKKELIFVLQAKEID